MHFIRTSTLILLLITLNLLTTGLSAQAEKQRYITAVMAQKVSPAALSRLASHATIPYDAP